MIRAGTSGYSYKEWKGVFYPKDLAPQKMLAHYAERLPVVEVNSTFYKRPTVATLGAWAAQVPSTFQFAFKASRYFSAGPGLKNARVPLAEFFALLETVKTKLGPMLVQLPQHIKKDVGLLRDFVAALPDGKRVTLDLVDPAWHCDEVRDVLRAREVALCVTDAGGEPQAEPVRDFVPTARWGYFRLRKEHYDARTLGSWAERLSRANLDDAYVFFKHDKTGPKHALTLMSTATPRSSGSPKAR